MHADSTEDLATGVDHIDREHETIFRHIDALIGTAGDDGDTIRAARDIVDVLKDHVVRHFGEEETTMRALGYPAREEHRAAHREIQRYIDSFDRELMADADPEILVAATRVLGNWILSHTKTFDRDLACFTRARGP